MRFKKIVMSLIASFCTLVIPVSVFADSAGWQLKTSEYVHWNDTLDRYITGVNNAHVSGDVLICLRDDGNSGGYKVSFLVKEYDPNNEDEVIMHYQLYPTTLTNSTDCFKVESSWYSVDGDNNQAEVYVQTTISGTKFAIYD
jgi:hypothetical protein